MRDMLTRIGGIDQCVTEFVRVSDRLLPSKVFHRLCPELLNGGATAAGVPVIVQLLGSDPQLLAENAYRAAQLGAPGIDLNFGCPAKTVNRHRGGSILLNDPEDVYAIVRQVRQHVPQAIPVTAKMRLGYQDKSLAIENAQAISSAGADGLTVHARTKAEGYRPPAHWEWIARIRNAVDIPVTANGEVWSYDDYQRCREVSGCEDVMIGRGLIAAPDLGLRIKAYQQGGRCAALCWDEMQVILQRYLEMVVVGMAPRYVHGRLKQWLKMMQRSYPQAADMLQEMRALRQVDEVRAFLQAYPTRSPDIA